MIRVVLVHEDHRILLCEGETLVGRGMHCDVRFNDAAVSREHLRLVAQDGRVIAENLSRSNGTLVNGVRIGGPVVLDDGDRIRVGHRELCVELIRAERRRHARPITLDDAPEAVPGSGLLIDDETVAEESTRPSVDDWIKAPSAGAEIPPPAALDDRSELIRAVASLASKAERPRRCPRCRGEIKGASEKCPACNYVGVVRFSGAITQEIKVDTVERRRSPRHPVRVPLIYASDQVTFEAMVHDISLGGMFVATELFDAAGTPCQLTAFPDGHPAIGLTGVVVRVVATAGLRGRPPGLGIRLTAVSREAGRWIQDVCAGATATED